MKKLILTGIIALGMGFAVQAVPLTGAITFAGGAQLDSSSVVTATQVTSWLDGSSAAPTVQSRDGGFSTFVTVGNSVTFAAPWAFNAGASPFWMVGGFTFNLTSSAIQFQGVGSLIVTGSGTISGNAFDPTVGTWRFSAQDPSAGTVGNPPQAVFSFSASSGFVPDGGATVALLGLALAGLGFMRSRMSGSKA